MKAALVMIAVLGGLAWLPTLHSDPRDVQVIKTAKASPTALHTAYPADRFKSLDLCNGKTADLDFDRVRPDHPIRLRVLCQDQSEVQVTIR